MKIGSWYDPIARKWYTPREVVPEPAIPVHESDDDKDRRIAKQRAIWDATTATAQATQQESIP